MASDEHISLLKQGVDVWNHWRRQNPERRARLFRPDLGEIDLSGADLNGANLSGADLNGANLSGTKLSTANLQEANLSTARLDEANLCGTDLVGANLSRANLLEAKLRQADLSGANLSEANLSWTSLTGAKLKSTKLSRASLSTADLTGANLNEADLFGADLNDAMLAGTMLENANLQGVRGLETCRHLGSSRLDHRTLEKSGPLPVVFLRGIGLSNQVVDYLPSLLNQPVQVYSCCISYSVEDQDLAERLHADLQTKGVRSYLVPHNMAGNTTITNSCEQAIRLRDKVLLILSEHAMASAWVEKEVWGAFAEERKRERIVLLPIRLDHVVLHSQALWAHKLRDHRHISDFTLWWDPDVYQNRVDQVVRDLMVAQDPASWKDAMSPSH